MMHRRFPGSAIALIVAIAAFIAVATPGHAATPDGTLHVSMGYIDSLDPQLGYSNSSFQVQYATCVKLVNYVDGGAIPVPEAASSMPSVSSDGLTYSKV